MPHDQVRAGVRVGDEGHIEVMVTLWDHDGEPTPLALSPTDIAVTVEGGQGLIKLDVGRALSRYSLAEGAARWRAREEAQRAGGGG